VELSEIKAIIDLMNQNSISEFELEKEDCKIKLRRSTSQEGVPETSISHYPAQPHLLAHTPPAALSESIGAAQSVSTDLEEITSPMIGTFYASPSPDAEAYAQVGAEVDSETVVCIIEAMKVMNEIKADKKGIIAEILVENGKPVEFGQPLFRIRQ